MKIAIITVTYNPNIIELKNNINSYINQVPLVIIVDNSTTAHFQDHVKSLQGIFSSIHLIQLGYNAGIAQAQNQGINYAILNNFDFIIEMDQDSSLYQLYIQKLSFSYLKLRATNQRVGAVGGIAINAKSGNTYYGLKRNVGLYKVDKTLSSGLLVPCSVFKEIGQKDAKLFIDLVDWEWCWRAGSSGYQTFIDSDIFVSHSLGEGRIKMLGLEIGVPIPIRHYYSFRNTLHLFSKNYVPLAWKIRTFFLLIFKMIGYPIILPEGKKRLKYIFAGITDYFNNRYGAFKS